MNDAVRQPRMEMNDFKNQLSGLLATLQKLPQGEKQAALDLLQLTLKDQVQSNCDFEFKDSSASQKSCAKKSQQRLCKESQHIHLKCHSLHVGQGDLQCVAHGDDKVKPGSQCNQATTHVYQNFSQEKFSIGILHQLSESRCLEETVVKVSVGGGKPSPHKELNAAKNEEFLLIAQNPREYEDFQEYEIKHGTAQRAQIRAVKPTESPCYGKNSVDKNSTCHEENTSEPQTTNDHDNYNIPGERTCIARTILPANTVGGYEEQSYNLSKYESVLEISSPEEKEAEPQLEPVPPLSHSDHQLALLSAQDLSHTNQGTAELTSLLDPQAQSKNVDSLEESSNIQTFVRHELLLTDDAHLRIVDVKQERNENRANANNKMLICDESSSSSFNLNFNNIGDRESLYTEENQYMLPYLEKESYEKACHKDNFSRKCHEQKELLSDLDNDKNPVDLSSATSIHSSKAVSVLNASDSFHCYQKVSIKSPLTKGYSYRVEANSCELNTYNKKQKQSEVRRFFRKRIHAQMAKDKLPLAKTNGSLTEGDILVIDKGCCEVVVGSNALEDNFGINKVTCSPETAQEISDTVVENGQAVPPSKFDHSVPEIVDAFDLAGNCSENQRRTEKYSCLNDPLDRAVCEIENRKEKSSSQNDPSNRAWCESKSKQEKSSCQNDTLEETECKNKIKKEKSLCQKEHLEEAGCENVVPGKLQPVSCRTCRRQLADISLFSVHQRQCGNPRLSCSLCHATFMHKVTYTRHVEGHKRNVCSKCCQSFCSHKKLKAHMKSEHNYNLISKLYPCPRCTRKFLKQSSLYHHLKIHATHSEVVCQKCGLFCKEQESFELHMADHIKSTKFHCHICPTSFKRRQQYDDHLKHHKKNRCEMCGEPFHTKRALLRHCRTEHKMLPQNIACDPEYKCDKCDRVFNRPSHLLQHLQLHSGMKVECAMCDKQFNHKRGLRKHLNSVNHGQMLQTNDMEKDHAYDAKRKLDFTCEYCGITLPTRLMLSKHSRSKHKVGITWSCPHCDYKTNRNHTLKRHMELHQESRNFMCEICGSFFQALATLKDHYSFVHSDERNYQCSECKKSFKNKSSLARHLRIHSDDRPYQCQCGTSYKRLSHLKRHMSSAHNEILKSRAVKKFNRPEELDSSTGKSLCGQSQLPNAEYSDGEEYEIVSVSNSALSPALPTESSVKDTSGILLPGQESIILMGENSNSGQSHIITVGDSQIIQLIPSTFFTQDNSFQAVSLVSSNEPHTLPMSSSASYAESGSGGQVMVEPFSLSQNSEALVVVPTSQEDQVHVQPDVMRTTQKTLEEADPLSLTSDQIFREPLKHEVKQEMSLHSIQSHGELNVSASLDSYDYTAASSSSPAFPSLPPARYFTHAHTHDAATHLTQDILQPNLICSDFVLPVSSNR